AATAARAACRVVFVLCNHRYVESRERLRVRSERSIRGSDENSPQLITQAGSHLHDARIERPCGMVGACNQFQLRADLRVGRARDWIELRRVRLLESRNTSCLR